jgi:hypothetical protein
MTNHNLLQEIDEDLERQKLEALWKRYGAWVIAAAVVVVLATAGYTAWHAWHVQQEQKATAALIGILSASSTDTGKQITALQSFAQKNRGRAPALFAQLQAAGIAAKAGDEKQAVSLYDAVANDSGADPAFRQLADLMAVQAQMDDGDPVVLQKRLQPLLADNAPWRYSAMEDEGFLALRAGDKAKAKQVFTELAQDAGVPPGIAARATDMARFIDE